MRINRFKGQLTRSFVDMNMFMRAQILFGAESFETSRLVADEILLIRVRRNVSLKISFLNKTFFTVHALVRSFA